MGEAHPPTGEEAPPTIPSCDKARGSRPQGRGDDAPEQRDFQLCPRCQQMVPGISMTSVVDGGWMCRTCRAQRHPPRPPAEQVASLHGWQAIVQWTLADGTIAVVVRALVYLTCFAGIDPQASVTQYHLHAALTGVLAGDLFAWAVFGLIDLSTNGRGLPIQVVAIGITNAAIIQLTGELPVPKDAYGMAIAFPFFLLTSAVKTAWWQVKRMPH